MLIIMDTNLVDILIKQHNELRREIAVIKEESQKDAPVFSALFAGLEQFNKSLLGHLSLEDNVFYPKLLEKLESQGLNTGDTRKFIEEMKEIEKQIRGFLGKYGSSGQIEKNLSSFKPDLNEMAVVLLIRIYSEENGVYLYWG